MHDSRRYRDSAAECLLAAQKASQSHCRKHHLSMAISWLSLARQYEAIERLFQGPGEAALIKGAHYLNGKWVYSTPESTSGTNSRMASAPENAGSQPPRFPELRSPATRPRPS